jgi:tryptophan-rich sensory protein
MTLRGIALAAGPPLAAAVIGSLGSRRAPQVYRRLAKPKWAPPSSVFGPVWSALYGLIGAAAWRMWRLGVPPRVWQFHGAQLALNAAWPWAFFALRDKRVSLVVIATLDMLLAAQIRELAKSDRLGAVVLAPYLSWSLFATALNAAVKDPATTR